jgi:hypothetical protein
VSYAGIRVGQGERGPEHGRGRIRTACSFRGYSVRQVHVVLLRVHLRYCVTKVLLLVVLLVAARGRGPKGCYWY